MLIVSVSSSRPSCLGSTIIQFHSHRHGSKINLSGHDQRLRFASTNDLRKRSYHINIIFRRHMAIYSGEGLGSNPVPPPPPPQTPSKLWILGTLLSAILHFWSNKWWPFLRLKHEVVDAVEDVVEMVETAAEEVGKVAEEVAEHLPHGGELQNAALCVENAAKRLSKDADLAEQIIHKIEEVEDEVISLFKKDGEIKEEDAK